MQRACVRLLSSCVVMLAVALPAGAQTSPRTEISGGYQFLSFDAGGENQSMPKGWYVDAAGNLTPMIGIVFQVGGNYKTFDESIAVGAGTFAASADLKVHQFLGGLRVSARQNSLFVPFAHVLAGAAHSAIAVTTTSTIPGLPSFAQEDSATNVAIELGGGVNLSVAGNAGVRFGVDYLRAFADDDGINAFRFHVGVVIGR